MTSAINTVTPILPMNARNMYQRKRIKKGGEKREEDRRREEESNWFVERGAT